MIEKILQDWYQISPQEITKMGIGAGSDTYVITAGEEQFVLKFSSKSDINNPELEPELCNFLLKKGIPVCEFILNKSGHYIGEEKEKIFHLQRFIKGKTYGWNEAPDWFMKESAQMLGKIHTILEEYPKLPEGIGKGFFEFMKPETARKFYEGSLQTARRLGHIEIEKDLDYRIEIVRHFSDYKIDVEKLTCKNTHGDYFISQFICGEGKIRAVIDWTTACLHPVIWEIMRSFVYAEPSCVNGEINSERFIEYVGNYLEYAPLNKYDIEMLGKLFYYQIAVCDYYGQFYGSDAANREIYLEQAVFSTKMIRWFEKHIEELTERLEETFLNK